MPLLFSDDPNAKLSPQLLTAIGTGLLSGNTWNEQLANAGLGANTTLAAQQQKQLADATKNKTVQMLQTADPELANAVAAGTMTPNDAFAAHIKKQQDLAVANKPVFQKFDDGSYGFVNPSAKTVDIVGTAAKPKIPEFKTLDDGTYGTWDGTKFTPLGKAAKPANTGLMNLGKGLIYDPVAGKYITPPPGTADNETEYGVTPVWFVDKDGNKRIGLPGKNGTLKVLDNPDGMTPLPGVNNLDTGTSFQTQDKKTGQIISSMPKDVEGKQAAIDRGKALTAAQVQLSGARQTAQMVQDGVQSIVNDPALDQALGPLDSRLPTWRTSTAGVEAKINQVKGQVFMQARQLLKGGGQITDFEGRKAEDAYARLSTAQSKEDFTKALTDFNSAVQEGLKKLEAQAKGNFDFDPNASQTPAKPVTAINPQTGERITLQNGQWVPAQ